MTRIIYKISTLVSFLVSFVILLCCVQISTAQDTLSPVEDADTTQSTSAVPDSATQDSNSAVSVPGTDTSRVDTAENVQSSKHGEQAEKAGDKSNISLIKELISLRKIALSLFVLLITYFITNIIVSVFDTVSEKFSSYRLFIKRLVPITRILIWMFAIYVVIEGIINPPLETLVAVAASVGLAVGFASQDILKNIFGGIMIILDRPFQVGDKISVGEHYGEVTQIGLRSSRMVTADDSVVAIPNAEIMNKAVSNSNTGALDCMVVAEIYIPVDVDISMVKAIARRAAVTSRYVYLKKPVTIVAVNEMHERRSMFKLRIKAYVLDIRYEFLFQSDMTVIMMEELHRRGISCQVNGKYKNLIS